MMLDSLPELLQMLGLGGGAVPPTTPPALGSQNLGVPYVSESGALPQSTQTTPEASDMPPMPTPSPTGMPATQKILAALGLGGGPPSPMMSPTAPPPYQQQTQSLGEALQPQQPQPAPGTPMPMPRPAGLGAPAAGGGGGVPTPQARPPGAPQAPGSNFGDIAKILQGIKQPQGPDVVKPSTPGVHQTKAIGPSDLMALLASLGMGGHRSQRTPTTLGQALELKPSAWGGMYG